MSTSKKPRRASRQASLQDYQDSLQGLAVFPVRLPVQVEQIPLERAIGKGIIFAGDPEFVPDSVEDTDEIQLIVLLDYTYVVLGTTYPARLQDLLGGDTLSNYGLITKREAEKINAWRAARKLQAWQNKLEIARAAIERIKAGEA